MFNDKTLLIDGASSFDISLTDDMVSQFYNYFSLVVENNKLFNLTSILEEKDFIIKHYIDSLAAVKYFQEDKKLLDIGAGGGFPSIPIAITRPDISVVALDSTSKKMSFVQNSADSLGLTNIKTVVGRVEDQKSLFGTFDIVIARAVSSLNILLELSLPMLKVGGVFIAYKTDNSELKLINFALNCLNAKFVEEFSFSLPNGDNRCILVFQKVSQTNSKYPRQYGIIKKNPL